MSRLRVVAAAAVLLLALAPPVRAAEAVSIEGTIANGTQGAEVPAALTVTAVQLDSGGEETARLQAPASNGSFRVDGFDSSRGSRYVVATDYSGVTYSQVAEGAGPVVSAALRIFETTDDDAVVSIPADTLTVVGGGEDRLEVLQLFKVRNSSDRTYVGQPSAEPRTVLRLPVPSGAFDLLPAEGITARTISSVAEGFAIADPLIPGDTSVSYLYKVRAPRGGWVLDRPVFYPTERFDLLTGPGIRVAGSGLTFEEAVGIAGRPYRRYRAGPFRAGGRVAADINGAEEPSRLYWWGLLGAGLLVAAGAGVATLRRRRSGPEPPRSAAAERAALIEEIAALDEAHAAGTVTGDAFEDDRARLKERLVALTEELAEQVGGDSPAEAPPASAAPAVSGTGPPGEPAPPGSS
ncbi:MAG: hypothetical protein ACRDJ4_03490 [Actinomycetota bacterium]